MERDGSNAHFRRCRVFMLYRICGDGIFEYKICMLFRYAFIGYSKIIIIII